MRAVIAAPVHSMEEVRAKAAFLLRPDFEAWDLLEEEASALGLLRSMVGEDLSAPDLGSADPVLTMAERWIKATEAYRDEPDETLTREREEALTAEIDEARRAVVEEKPTATTPAGAASALRCLLADIDAGDPTRLDEGDRALIGAALGYLESLPRSPTA